MEWIEHRMCIGFVVEVYMVPHALSLVKLTLERIDQL